MNNVIIVHGSCDRQEYYENECKPLIEKHWFPWLKKELLSRGIFVQMPEMPKPHKPIYEEWQMKLKNLKIDEGSIMIGYDCGGGFLLRWLTENKIKIKKLILIAPWMDPERKRTEDFFDFQVDNNIIKRAGKIDILFSNDDEGDVLRSVNIIKESLPEANFYSYRDRGHFTSSSMGTDDFPELLEMILV